MVNLNWLCCLGGKQKENKGKDKEEIELENEGEVRNSNDWKDIHPDFTLKLQKEWENWNFSHEEVREWIGSDLTPQEFEFAAFLYNNDYKPQDLNNDNREELIEEFNEYKKWKEIHKDFGDEETEKWKEKGFTYRQTKQWIEAGLTANYYEFASYLKNGKKVSPEWILTNVAEFQGLAKRYKKYGLCEECQQLNTGYHQDGNNETSWCQVCMSQHFQAGFKNWTSGNQAVDQIIQDCQLRASDWTESLEWIPYEQFTEIEHIADGGFAQVYKAKLSSGLIKGWNAENKKLERTVEAEVVLKSLNNSQNKTADFLQEVVCTKLFGIGDIDKDKLEEKIKSLDLVAPCWGISQDPVTKNYVMVMAYMKDGSLRKYLQAKSGELEFKHKFRHLFYISMGLSSIHKKGLVHQDFHTGNILVIDKDDGGENAGCFISDLGLSRPANETKQAGQIFGVMSYVAPEVLQGQPYTQASDIYSFGIVAYEVLTGLPPYYDREHDTKLVLKICQGARPQFQIKIPQLLEDLISRCWDADPLKRPTAQEIIKNLLDWDKDGENSELSRQIKESKRLNQTLPKEIRFPKYEIHSGAVYHSKAINTKEIVAKLLQNPADEQALEQEIKKIEQEINQPLTGELKELVRDFIQARKMTIKDKENKEAEDKAWELADKLKEKGLSENVDEIIKYCERFIEEEQQLEQENLQANIETPTNNK